MKIRSKAVIIGLISTIILQCHGLNAAPRQNIKQSIQSACNQADAAAMNKNLNGAVACYADPSLQSAIKKGLEHILAIDRSPHFSTKIISIDIGKTKMEALVVVIQHYQGLIRSPQTGSDALAVLHAKVRQYWIKKGPNWMILKSRVLTMKRTLNNKPVNSF